MPGIIHKHRPRCYSGHYLHRADKLIYDDTEQQHYRYPIPTATKFRVHLPAGILLVYAVCIYLGFRQLPQDSDSIAILFREFQRTRTPVLFETVEIGAFFGRRRH